MPTPGPGTVTVVASAAGDGVPRSRHRRPWRLQHPVLSRMTSWRES